MLGRVVSILTKNRVGEALSGPLQNPEQLCPVQFLYSVMDQVASGLYVGTLADAGNTALLQDNGIDEVVSLTHGDPEAGYPESVSVTQCAMMNGYRNERETFREAVAHVVAGLERGEAILVHCSRGASRSPSVAATALALSKEIDIEESFELVGEQRGRFNPHTALVQQAVSVYQEYPM